MEELKEIIETLNKVNNFIESNNNINYNIRLLEREVPNLKSLVEKLNTAYPDLGNNTDL